MTGGGPGGSGSAGGSDSADSSSDEIPIATSGPFSANIYASPVNGFYCDAVTTYTYSNMVADLAMLKSSYADVSYSSLATTLDGRKIYEVSVGNPSAPHKIMLVATLHGREYMCSQLVMRQLHDILARAASGQAAGGVQISELLKQVCIVAVPMVNPDGASLSQYGLNSIRNESLKNQVQNIMLNDQGRERYTGDTDWYYRRWKNNLNGTDPNRNFPLGWEQLDDSRHQPSYEYYKGAAVLSEIESRAMVDVLNKQHIDEVLNYHAQGGIVYWSFTGAPAGVNERSAVMARIVRANAGYYLAGATGDDASGGSAGYKEYLATIGIPSVTVEIGSGSCPLPETDITGIWNRNRNVLPELVAELSRT